MKEKKLPCLLVLVLLLLFSIRIPAFAEDEIIPEPELIWEKADPSETVPPGEGPPDCEDELVFLSNEQDEPVSACLRVRFICDDSSLLTQLKVYDESDQIMHPAVDELSGDTLFNIYFLVPGIYSYSLADPYGCALPVCSRFEVSGEEEITAETFEKHAAEIFDEAENRLHAHKAIMVAVMGAYPGK